jgi:methyltransferase family protein
MIDRCPICGSRRLHRSLATAHLRLQRCLDCSHRLAEHEPAAPPAADYHEQYGQGQFLESLATTRRRQAAVIIELIRRQLPQPDRLLDFGAGRGWFLEACRQNGFRELAGADSSLLAVTSLRDRGFAAQLVPGGDRLGDLAPLPFQPRILTLLDVVEHFPVERLQPILTGIIDPLRPALELVVMKVPAAEGLLYRSAVLLGRLGATGPIEQLYQVGTDPPHLSYFTSRSMVRLLSAVGLQPVDSRGDRDFEPSSLAARARAAHRLPSAAALLAGWAIAASSQLTGAYDSVIYVARPRSG